MALSRPAPIRDPDAAGAGAGASPGAAPPARPQGVGFLLSALGWNQANRFRRMLEPFGVEPREFAVLRALAGAEGQSQQAVCGALGIPASRMVGLVDALEARGLVERRLNAHDRRARAVHLTDPGRELLAGVLAAAGAMEAELCRGLSGTERQTLLDLLGRVADDAGLPVDIHPDLTTRRPQPWPGAPGDT